MAFRLYDIVWKKYGLHDTEKASWIIHNFDGAARISYMKNIPSDESSEDIKRLMAR